MSKVILLDTGPLGMIVHPRPKPDILVWLGRLLLAKTTIIIPEIADYELRRELLRIGSMESIGRLDALRDSLHYLPLTTETMRKAAEFWAEARRQGKPTSDDKALDGDMILCAQAALVANPEDEIVIATTNVGHLARFSRALLWKDIYPS